MLNPKLIIMIIFTHIYYNTTVSITTALCIWIPSTATDGYNTLAPVFVKMN
jgi:hypothetical protein